MDGTIVQQTLVGVDLGGDRSTAVLQNGELDWFTWPTYQELIISNRSSIRVLRKY